MSSINRHMLGSAITTLFATLGFVFALVAITSKEWVMRNEYSSTDPVQWLERQYRLYRSPFAICNYNGTNVTCHHFHPFGKNTSCEAISRTGNLDADSSGDARLCEQIHLAGHFAIASTTLISVGFLLSLALLAFAITMPSTTSEDGTAGRSQSRHGRNHSKHAQEGVADGLEATPVEEESTLHRRSRATGWSSYASFLMLVCLSIGIMTALLSQFYTILGLIQSAPNNADFASSSAITDSSLRQYDSWYQGKALSVYETCAWGFAAVGTVIATRTWKMPACY
ncbi:hypothetical protein EDD36DRAFT_490113 [Exophiala viscosa]|uniref:Uncharacterized protein n=1 Tax=Exophiala viscosa TaxID=2486360 RepID=A0AAN6DTJ7_9EURO|nr:hypothetical protein EDD36DRAFT_490113 [Exophiala viscosa]